jgi:hypothetical protein
MSERHGSPYDSTARKWLALVERRQQNFVELWHTGRWQCYYTHAQFLDEMRKVLDLRNHWARLAGVDLAGVPPSEQTNIRESIKQAGSKQAGGKQADPLRGENERPDPAARPAGRAGQRRTSAAGRRSDAPLTRWT